MRLLFPRLERAIFTGVYFLFSRRIICNIELETAYDELYSRQLYATSVDERRDNDSSPSVCSIWEMRAEETRRSLSLKI